MANMITIETMVHAPIEKVWQCWTEPQHITQWLFATDDWECPKSENDLRVGGKFSSTMRAKDLSMGFDFGGTYTEVEPNQKIAYVIGDGRKVAIFFSTEGDQTKIVESFEMESQNSEERQRSGWQSILDNFKKYVESQR